MTIKSTKTTPQTFSVTWEFEKGYKMGSGQRKYRQHKKLKALTILLGNFNPMRKEMADEEAVLKIVQDFRGSVHYQALMDAIDDIASELA